VVYFKIYENKTASNAAKFLENVIEYYPFKIHTILTDNGFEFTDRFRINNSNKPSGNHQFDKVCKKYKITHKLIKPKHPQTNGMVEKFNAKISNIIDTVTFKDKKRWRFLYGYLYNYNHYIKHSGINRLTPFEKLKELYKQNSVINEKDKNDKIVFTKTLDEFIKYDNKLFEKYSVELDNYRLLSPHPYS